MYIAWPQDLLDKLNNAETLLETAQQQDQAHSHFHCLILYHPILNDIHYHPVLNDIHGSWALPSRRRFGIVLPFHQAFYVAVHYISRAVAQDVVAVMAGMTLFKFVVESAIHADEVIWRGR